MSGSQIILLIVAVLLLLPDGAFLVFGFSSLQLHNGLFAVLFLLPGTIFLATTALLFWAAFRREGSRAAMSRGRIAALVFAFLLLLPAAAGLFLGSIFAYSRFNYLLLPIAVAILGFAACLFWVALRHKSQIGCAGEGLARGEP